jgi:hypothetical protein
MEYLNEFHKQSSERKIKKLANYDYSKVNYDEELKRHQAMHKAEKDREAAEAAAKK